MKKILCLCIAVAVLCSVSACGGKGETASSEARPVSGASSEQAGNSGSSGGESGLQSSSGINSSEQSVTAAEDIELYKAIFESETAWLASMQLDNGAVPMTPVQNGNVSMNPYFADFAALALLDDADKYSTRVKKYTEWHFEHLNTAEQDYNGVDGTIYDYTLTVSDGKVTGETVTEKNGKKSYDSTDSYAATFLSVLKKYYEKTGDSAYIISRKSDIARVINAMLATMNDGLTFAKPDYAVKYLMDNCEVYKGALDAEFLLEKVVCPADSAFNGVLNKVSNAAKQIYETVENSLWNPSGGYYEAGLFKDGQVAYDFSWDTFYPCATAQLFPVSFGLISPESERAKSLYNSFSKSYDWQNFKIPDSFYWGSNVYAAAVMNDGERVAAYMNKYKKIIKKHAYPLYNADAAKVSMAAYLMLERPS